MSDPPTPPEYGSCTLIYHRCPVCTGRGSVPQGFYDPRVQVTGTLNIESCRRCTGSGTVEAWRYDVEPQPPPTLGVAVGEAVRAQDVFGRR